MCDQRGTAERRVNLKGTWSHAEVFNRSTDDAYRFVSLLQCSTVYSVTCKVIQRDGFSNVAVRTLQRRRVGSLILLNIVNIIWSLKTRSSLMEVSDVLVHFLFFGIATPSLLKKRVWFHNDLKMR